MHVKKSVTRAGQIAVPLLATAALATACGSSSGHTASSSTSVATSGASLELTGGHLADGAGRTVYLWEGDHGATSSCSGACASVWPPVTTSAAPTAGTGVTASDLTTVKRSDGRMQLVYAGHPLYYYADDSAPGQTNGQGSNGFGASWWEVGGSGQPITTTSGAGAPTSAPTPSSSTGYGYGY